MDWISRSTLERGCKMPSLTIEPAQLEWMGQSIVIEPVRVNISPVSLSWDGGFILVGPGTGTSLSVTTPTLDRLRRVDRLTQGEFVDVRFQLIWQRTMEAIENAFEALTTQVNDMAILVAEIRAAQALATAANDTATTVNSRTSIESSYTDPTSVLTASADGTITIAAHTRRYTDGTSASVNAGSISGGTNGVRYTVYYADAAREGGAVSYQSSTDVVAQGGSIHVVGRVTVPALGEPPASGASPSAPGVPPPAATDPSQDYFVP
jgi:hypothetical protein